MLNTSYNKDFQWPIATGWGIKKWIRERNLEEDKFKTPHPVHRNNETLAQLTEEGLLPFHKLLFPKPIIQTNPLSSYPILELPKDDGSARFTRPRVYKAPEISLDDIQDPNIREKIIDYTYSTTWGLASKDAGKRITKRQIPNSTWEPPDHVRFSKKDNLENTECEEEITDAMLNEWDRLQSRAIGDSTLAFWQRFKNDTPVRVVDQATLDLKSPQLTTDILQLARENRLRRPYTLRLPGYTGFLPESPLGMEREIQVLDISDPMQTTAQLANRWREMETYYK
uniref:Uncharacterized protein n=1 Tax=Graphocephala atropunctata TaxID=36148 RepID=A0A1B6M3S4_9HEMI